MENFNYQEEKKKSIKHVGDIFRILQMYPDELDCLWKVKSNQEMFMKLSENLNLYENKKLER